VMRNYAGKTYRYPQVQEPVTTISNPSGSTNVTANGAANGAANGTVKREHTIRVPEPAAFLE